MLFADVKIPLRLMTKKKERDGEVSYITMGDCYSEKMPVNEMIRQYNEVYKPLVHYKFSKYSYEYRLEKTLDTDRSIKHARLTIAERIQHNVENLVEYNLKKIDNE